MLVRRLVVSLSLAFAVITVPVAASYAADPTDLYVRTPANGGDDAHACTDAEPCASVQRAVDLAASTGTTVHVGAGSFNGEIEPGSTSVSIVGASVDDTTLTTPQGGGDGYVLGISAGTTHLSDLTVQGGLFMDVFVNGTGTFTGDHVLLAQAGCGLVVSAGAAHLTDSTVQDGGTACLDISTPSANVVVTGGAVSLVRTQVLNPQEDVAGVAVTGGMFSADQSLFDDAGRQSLSNSSQGLDVTGGMASVARSVFHAFGTGVVTEGGTASVADSTFDDNVVGVTSSSGAATVVRSTLQGELASLQQQDAGTLGVAGSLLGDDDIKNCAGAVDDLGYNLATDDSCGFTGTSHDSVSDLNLDTQLTDRGGPLFLHTVAIFDPSSAMDAIPADATYGDDDIPLCPDTATDIRGVLRPAGGACDAGSMEMAEVVTKVRAQKKAAPHDDLQVTAEMSVPQVDLGLDLPNGTVTFRGNGEVLCADVLVDREEANCFVPDVAVGRLDITAEFTPSDFNTLHPSTSPPRTVLVGTEPMVKGPDTVRARVGRSVDVDWHASGEPTPRLRKVGGHLPGGMTFTHPRGTFVIMGTPKPGTAGTYHLRVKATNLVGHDTHRVTIVVKPRSR